jgi:hypothetical protein
LCVHHLSPCFLGFCGHPEKSNRQLDTERSAKRATRSGEFPGTLFATCSVAAALRSQLSPKNDLASRHNVVARPRAVGHDRRHSGLAIFSRIGSPSVAGRAIQDRRPSAGADVTSHRLRRHRPPRDDWLVPDPTREAGATSCCNTTPRLLREFVCRPRNSRPLP